MLWLIWTELNATEECILLEFFCIQCPTIQLTNFINSQAVVVSSFR